MQKMHNIDGILTKRKKFLRNAKVFLRVNWKFLGLVVGNPNVTSLIRHNPITNKKYASVFFIKKGVPYRLNLVKKSTITCLFKK